VIKKGTGYFFGWLICSFFYLCHANATDRQLAVIFNGPTICKGCADPVAKLFQDRGFEIKYVQPGESSRALLKRAAVYAVPGGEDIHSTDEGWTASDREAIRSYVRDGGRYLGFCLGAFWVSNWAGEMAGFQPLNIVPLSVSAGIDKTDKLVKVNWRGQWRTVYFQDGPSFALNNRDPESSRVDIIARYEDGNIATFITPYGRGKVAASGVHVEATQDWYDDVHLPSPDGLNKDLAKELLDSLLN
jgi:glutamine amidotransferase-like uncharacterized protein